MEQKPIYNDKQTERKSMLESRRPQVSSAYLGLACLVNERETLSE